MLSRRREVSLASKFRLSYQPREIMLRKLALKTQKKVHLVDSAMYNITVGIHPHFDIVYNVQSAL
jgi:hypothetical protein